MEVIQSKSKISTRILDDKPAVTVEISIEANVGEVECKLDLESRDSLSKLKELAIQQAHKLISEGIRNVQAEYGVDIFGFGKHIHQKHPAYWAKWRDNWNEKFSEMEVDVIVNYKIAGRGTIVNPLLKEDK